MVKKFQKVSPFVRLRPSSQRNTSDLHVWIDFLDELPSHLWLQLTIKVGFIGLSTSMPVMAIPIHTLCIGHSFIRRADEYLERHSIHNLNLTTQYHTVSFLSRSGAHISDILPLFVTCASNPEVVIIDAGTNDLVSDAPVQALAANLLKVAKTILKSGVKRIIILETLERTPGGKHGAPPRFNVRVREYNRHLKFGIKNHRNIAYWYHKGLANNSAQYVFDGVHLTKEGNKKDVRSLREAVRKYTKDIQ